MGEERGKVRCVGLNTRCARAHDADSRRAIVSGVFWGAVGTRAPLRARVQFQKVIAAMFYGNTVFTVRKVYSFKKIAKKYLQHGGYARLCRKWTEQDLHSRHDTLKTS